MRLNGESQAVLKCDTTGSEQLSFDYGWAKQPRIARAHFLVGIPCPEVGKCTDIACGLGAVFRKDFHLGIMAKVFSESEEKVVRPMLAPLQAMQDLLLDCFRRIMRSDPWLHTTHMVFGIIRIGNIPPQVDGDHPWNLKVGSPGLGADCLIQVLEQVAVYRNLIAPTLPDDFLGLLLRKEMPCRHPPALHLLRTELRPIAAIRALAILLAVTKSSPQGKEHGCAGIFRFGQFPYLRPPLPQKPCEPAYPIALRVRDIMPIHFLRFRWNASVADSHEITRRLRCLEPA